jgi:hypothetical protein
LITLLTSGMLFFCASSNRSRPRSASGNRRVADQLGNDFAGLVIGVTTSVAENVTEVIR